jgi:hypothetical protein
LGTGYEGPVIQLPQGVPALEAAPRATPVPAAKPEGENRTAALPAYRAVQFQLIPSPTTPTPVYAASGISRVSPASELPMVDEGWQPAAR